MRSAPPVRDGRSLQIRRALKGSLALALGFLSTCTDVGPAAPDGSEAIAPSFDLSDGTSAMGNPDFFWLPPATRHPDLGGSTFDPNLAPVIDVCMGRLVGNPILPSDCTAPVVEGAEAELEDNAYRFNWKTPRSPPEEVFTVLARIDEVVLGHLHVVAARRRDASPMDGDYLVNPGSTATLRFHLGTNALCLASDPDFVQGSETCTSQSLGGDGGEVVLVVGGTPTLSVRIPATGVPTTITISTECSEEWPLALPVLSDCFNIEESAGIEFSPLDPAIVCLLPGGGVGDTEGLVYHDQITLYQFTSSYAEALPRVDCDEEEVVAMARPGIISRFAHAIGSFFAPEPLHAAIRRRINLGGGGSIINFRSDVLFSVPLAIERFGFDQGQLASPGTTLDASVRLYYEGLEGPEPYDGTEHPILVEFAVTGGGGSVDPTSFLVDDDTGVGTTDWTLGESAGFNTMVATAGDGFGNNDGESGGPFYSDFGVTEVIFGEGFVTFEAEVEEEEEAIVTIDGIQESAWDNAQSFDVFSEDGDLQGSTLYVLNDASNLYIGLRVFEGLSANDEFEMRFDSPVDGVDTAGDDNLFLTGASVFADTHFNGSWGGNDAVTHGEGAVGSDEGSSFYEVSHPLDSGDGQDLAVSPGGTFGLCIRFFKDGVATSATTFPVDCPLAVNTQALYEQVTLPAPIP